MIQVSRLPVNFLAEAVTCFKVNITTAIPPPPRSPNPKTIQSSPVCIKIEKNVQMEEITPGLTLNILDTPFTVAVRQHNFSPRSPSLKSRIVGESVHCVVLVYYRAVDSGPS